LISLELRLSIPTMISSTGPHPQTRRIQQFCDEQGARTSNMRGETHGAQRKNHDLDRMFSQICALHHNAMVDARSMPAAVAVVHSLRIAGHLGGGMRCTVFLMSIAIFGTALAIRRGEAAVGPFGDKPESPRSLPADNLPPFRMLDERGTLPPIPPPPPGGLHHGPGSAPESMAPGPTLLQAIAAAQAAVASCRAAGYRVGVSVIDSVGEVRAMLTADGADGSHVFVGTRKALTALAFKVPSATAVDMIAADATLLSRVKPNMFVMGGALPIVRGAEVIGAIGVSGAGGMPFGHQDELCAAAGRAKMAANSD